MGHLTFLSPQCDRLMIFYSTCKRALQCSRYQSNFRQMPIIRREEPTRKHLAKQDAAQLQLVLKGYEDTKEVDRKLSHLVIKPSFTICDVGGSSGKDLLSLVEKCAFAVNLDIDTEKVKRAKSTFKAHICNSKLECIRASAVQLPFKDETFDLATCFSVIDHLVTKQNAHLAISELSRITRPGGFVAATVPNKLFLPGTVAMNVKKILEPEMGRTFEQRFTPAELRKRLASSGLTPVIFASKYPCTIASMQMIMNWNLPRFLKKMPQIMVALSLCARILRVVEKTQVLKLTGARMGYLCRKN
jgi:ubiquinone/menaquinone biosynthesis C-methylase UbiE